MNQQTSLKTENPKTALFGIMLFVGILCVVLSLNSCRKEISRPFRIVNSSGVDILNMSFGGAIEGDAISLGMGQTSEIIYLSYERRIRVTPKILRVSINSVLPTSNLIIVQPNAIPFDKKDLSEYNNILTITSKEAGDSLFFYAELD